MNAFIQRFIREIKGIRESDYGDFMRSSNLYLNELQGRLEESHFPVPYRKIEDIKAYLQYCPNWDVDSTQSRLIHDATELDKDLDQLHAG
jgi:hypothetical protein